VPEAPLHDEVAQALKLLLCVWAARSTQQLRIARNLAIRWLEEHPSTGIDPDVCVLAPPPDNLDELGSLYLWKQGHFAPTLCFEVVSVNHPHKDYAEIQDRYAAMGTHELIVFDPLLAGPRSLGGPVALQLWRRDAGGGFERLHFGSSPVYSEVLDAWVIAEGKRLVIADDRTGKHRWQNEAQLHKAEAEAARVEMVHAKADADRAKADADRAKADADRAKADADRARANAKLMTDLVETEKAAREALEQELAKLKAKLGRE
jgi:hypothetical protein